MNSLNETDTQRLQAISSILIRCFVLTVAALLFVALVVFVAGDSIYRLQSVILGISKEQALLLTVGFLTFMKCLNVTFFLIPWAAIRLYLRQDPNSQ